MPELSLFKRMCHLYLFSMLSRLFSKYFLLCSQNLVTRKGSSTVSSQVPEPQILLNGHIGELNPYGWGEPL